MAGRTGGWRGGRSKALQPRARSKRGLVIGAVGALLTLLAALVFAAPALGIPGARGAHAAPHTRLAATRYGPDAAKVKAAVTASGWPQARNNWCGVATIAAIADYPTGTATQTQASVSGWMTSSAAVSQWGTPAPDATDYGPGFGADISRDLGTDPRSLAAALGYATGKPYRQVVALNGAQAATAALVADLVNGGLPISVIVTHGQHSVLVGGVMATADPVANPSSITALEVWDPGAGSPYGQVQQAQAVMVDIGTWLSSASYWGTPYSANYVTSSNKFLDPDPAVGPYNVSVNPRAQLWIGHYVYLRQADNTAGVDWATTTSGAVILGVKGEAPAGYTGATVPMPILPPPPPQATPTPYPTAVPLPVLPTPIPNPSFPTHKPVATATATAVLVGTAPQTTPVVPTPVATQPHAGAPVGALFWGTGGAVALLLLGGGGAAWVARRRARLPTPLLTDMEVAPDAVAHTAASDAAPDDILPNVTAAEAVTAEAVTAEAVDVERTPAMVSATLPSVAGPEASGGDAPLMGA